MIQIYDSIENDFESNGSAVLFPTSCTITEEAGASYDLEMTCPIDPRGAWRYIQPNNIVKAPVPVNETEPTISEDSVNVWKVTATSTPLRASASVPQKVSYPAWNNTLTDFKMYSVGDKVTYSGQNYMLKTPVGVQLFTAPSSAKCWIKIANQVGGGEVLSTLRRGTELYWRANKGTDWVRVMTMAGVEGYVLKNAVAFDRKIKPEAQKKRSVSEQLFRIYSTTVNTKNRTVSANARHVSYDLAGDVIGDCVFTNMAPSTVLALTKERLYDKRDITLSTNLLTEVDGAFTGDFTHKNGINALLDPDTGFVNFYKAKLIRDNWDFFVYRNEETDSGIALRYGVNLKGVTWNVSAENLITRVMPVAKAANGSNLYISNRWVDSPQAESYPVIRMEVLNVDGQVGKSDGKGGTWTVESLTAHMADEAQKRFDVDNADKLNVEIKVDFLLLGDTEEYRQYRGMQKLHLYDSVTVIDENIGLEQTLQIRKTEWDAVNGRYNSVTLGDIFDYSLRTIAGYEISNGAIQYNKLSPSAIAKLKEA